MTRPGTMHIAVVGSHALLSPPAACPPAPPAPACQPLIPPHPTRTGRSARTSCGYTCEGRASEQGVRPCIGAQAQDCTCAHTCRHAAGLRVETEAAWSRWHVAEHLWSEPKCSSETIVEGRTLYIEFCPRKRPSIRAYQRTSCATSTEAKCANTNTHARVRAREQVMSLFDPPLSLTN